MTADANGWYDLDGNRTVLRQPINWFGPHGNKFCPDCGRRIDDVSVKRSMEHLIGRKFVPVGSFDGGRGFNFIFNSCEECNGQKSVYEGQLSAVSQFSSVAIADDPTAAARALHKAQKVIHETTRKPIVESFMRTEIKSDILSLGFVGPPQPEPSMVKMLACRHVQGMFALVTNLENPASDSFVMVAPDRLWILGHYLQGDWGNAQVRAVIERVRGWRPYASVGAASGYFRCVLRRNDEGDRAWFWALEWNGAVRVVGGISRGENLPAFMGDLPELAWSPSARLPGGRTLRSRTEEPQLGADDLFDVPRTEFERRKPA